MDNERKAHYELYKITFPILMSICLRYERNREDAESNLNLGFLKIVQNLEKYSVDVPFEAWIRKVMINTIIDEYRKNRKGDIIEYQDLEEMRTKGGIDFNAADLAFDVEELEMMLRQLPVVSQKVFNLYIIDGYNHKEIGELLGMSDGTSKWHLSFARQKLRMMIAEKAKLMERRRAI